MSLIAVPGKLLTLSYNANKMALRMQSNDMAKFRNFLKSAKKIVFLSGAGMSAESGIPTFRGPGGYWRNYKATELATPEAFEREPGLVWEFYHYRREVAAKAKPNPGHIAVAEYENKHTDKEITVITQNVDGLHRRAGTKNLLEIHGSLYKTRCTKCGEVLHNTDSPICPALANRGAPDKEPTSSIPRESLPHCKKSGCGGLLRPHIVWFGEGLEVPVFEKAEAVQNAFEEFVASRPADFYKKGINKLPMRWQRCVDCMDAAMSACEVCVVIGTSNRVYPAAGFAKLASVRGAVVAEFNVEPTDDTHGFDFFFEGPSGKNLPPALAD